MLANMVLWDIGMISDKCSRNAPSQTYHQHLHVMNTDGTVVYLRKTHPISLHVEYRKLPT